MNEPRQPEEGATIEDIATPAWDRSSTVANDAGRDLTGDGGAVRPGSRRSGLRWVVALLGIIVVVAGSAVIVTLAGARPAASVAVGYMPAATFSYTELRLDLPGDQRQKLAEFLKAFPGFADQSQIEPKLNDVLDRLVRAASKDKQTWAANIEPWFGGQLAVGQGMPSTAGALGAPMASMSGTNMLMVATISSRTKAADWIASLDPTAFKRTTYNGADLFTLVTAADTVGFDAAVAVTDKVMLAGSESAVKAAVDSNGNGPLLQDPDIKAALATIDRDYVALTVMRLQPYFDGFRKLIAEASPGMLDQTTVDETLMSMVPAWEASALRFENDSLVSAATAPAGKIGYDGSNRASGVVGHVPAKAILYSDVHDVGPALSAILAKFRALPETKPAFDQLDQALSVVGGFDAAVGWMGDTAFVVAPNADGTIGGGLVVKPRDAAAAERLFTTIGGFVSLGGRDLGVTLRTEDHAGTKISIVDFSGMAGANALGLPAGYKPELAWATNADVTVVGYGRDFVASVLDSGPGNSLADDARFKALLGRVGAENTSASFVDVAAIRSLVEPIAKSMVPADRWAYYETDIKPYLAPFDALIQATRKDGQLDRSSGLVTVH